MGVQTQERRIRQDQLVEISSRRKGFHAGLWSGLPGYIRTSCQTRNHSSALRNRSCLEWLHHSGRDDWSVGPRIRLS